MASIQTLRRIAAIAAIASMITATSAVDDCCTALNTTNSFRNELDKGVFCSSVWVSTQRTDGKLCLPLGSGYSCGIQTTLTVGQEFTLSADVSIGGGGAGATIGASTTYSVSQAFTHTAGNCESCQLFASYGNVTLRQWEVSSFYAIGADTVKTRSTFQKRGAPTIVPCCEVNNNCSGCPEDESSNGMPVFMDPAVWGSGVNNRGDPSEITYIVDLRIPESYSGSWPVWHPMNSPGMTFATLNCWQVWEILREIAWMSMIEPEPVTELVIIDTDGTPFIFDLVNDPGAFGGCPADLDCNGILDLSDVGLFISYFTFGDPTVDFNFDGVLDLVDITTFTGAFVDNCE